jgi:hypothetical protein
MMHERFPHTQMADELERMVAAKQVWLREFSTGMRKRPDHEIEHKRQELHVLEQAAFDYRRAAKRDASRAETGTGLGNSPVSAAGTRRVDARQNLHPEQKELARNAY